MIHTERLIIKLLSDEETEEIIRSEEAEKLKAVYADMLQKSKAYPKLRELYAPWEVCLNDGTKIGCLAFKGLEEDGTAKLCCMINPEYEKAYAEEAVEAMHKWASIQPMVKAVAEY